MRLTYKGGNTALLRPPVFESDIIGWPLQHGVGRQIIKINEQKLYSHSNVVVLLNKLYAQRFSAFRL